VPKILINDTVCFLKLQSAFWQFQIVTVSECCLVKLLPYNLFEKCITILALELASPGKRHCASCIGTLSFHIVNVMSITSCYGTASQRSRRSCPLPNKVKNIDQVETWPSTTPKSAPSRNGIRSPTEYMVHWSPESMPRMICRSFQPFLQGPRSRATDRHADRRTTLRL